MNEEVQVKNDENIRSKGERKYKSRKSLRIQKADQLSVIFSYSVVKR